MNTPKRSMYSVFAACLATLALCLSAVAKSYDVETESGAEFVPAAAVTAPSPSIPSSLQEECFKSFCSARFQIAADGTAKVKLLTTSGSDEIDDITLSALRKWKFKPAMLDGKPVPSTRRIRVEYQVD